MHFEATAVVVFVYPQVKTVARPFFGEVAKVALKMKSLQTVKQAA